MGKYVLGLCIIVAVFIGGSLLILYFTSPSELLVGPISEEYKVETAAPGAADANALSETTIAAGVTTVHLPVVTLAQTPGFVVIHSDIAGLPGELVGATGLIPVGSHADLSITLIRPPQSGEQYIVSLRTDSNANSQFDAPEIDQAASGQDGKPVMQFIRVQ